jgi:murein DD-endopeptidase MepM/ murein hydrolase activator NlpD
MSVRLLMIFLMLWGYPVNHVTQDKYPKNYFRSPVDFPIHLSGSFGEVRKNHFHSGIDIRTEGVEGKPVFAVADGYVSRIFISQGGFGKALYINHPSGFTTVYGHLKAFNNAIGTWVRSKQYKDESFEQDATLEPGVLKVKKGEIIAYSGNTGMSGGPHLHFETRETASQEIVDPLLFGLPVKDIIPPRIYNVRIYPFGDNGQVNFSDKPVTLSAKGSDGRFSVNSKEIVNVSGNVIFAIEAFDFVNDSEMKNGINAIDLYVDTACVFSQKLDRFAFAETRYVNSLLDYPAIVEHQQRFQRSYVAPNNKLKIYNLSKNRGIVSFTDTKVHKIRYMVKDVFGNSSSLEFSVVSKPLISFEGKKLKTPRGKWFSCQSVNHFTTNELIFDVPSDALYEDLDFIYSSSSNINNSFSSLHHLQNEDTPLHTYCDLSIRPENLSAKLTSKAVIVRVSENNSISSVGGKWENDYIKTRIRDFGNYTIMVDTTKPLIRPINTTPNKKSGTRHSLQFKISDNLSGIKSYRGTLNGKWILMDFDAKSGLLIYEYDDRMKPGKNDFNLVVKDAVGNERQYKAVLMR